MPDSGTHICLRASSVEAVQAFHAAALAGGGASDGAPGPRPEYIAGYYAAFMRDPEGNKIEAVTFTTRRALIASHPPGHRRLHRLLRFGDALHRLRQHRQDVLDAVGHQIVDGKARRG